MPTKKGPVQAPAPTEDAAGEVAETPKKRAMPVRVEPVELEEEYEGWVFYVNRNFTFGEMEKLLSSYYNQMREGLRATVVGWDNFVDRDGLAIPFVSQEQLKKEQDRYAQWVAERDEAQRTKKAFDKPLMEPPVDPWNELTTDIIHAMARAALGLPLPNR